MGSFSCILLDLYLFSPTSVRYTLHIYIYIDTLPLLSLPPSLVPPSLVQVPRQKRSRQQTTATLTMTEHDDDLVASKTEGFKVGEKKTIEEYTKLGMSRLLRLPYASHAGNSSLHSGLPVSPLPQARLLQADY